MVTQGREGNHSDLVSEEERSHKRRVREIEREHARERKEKKEERDSCAPRTCTR